MLLLTLISVDNPTYPRVRVLESRFYCCDKIVLLKIDTAVINRYTGRSGTSVDGAPKNAKKSPVIWSLSDLLMQYEARPIKPILSHVKAHFLHDQTQQTIVRHTLH